MPADLIVLAAIAIFVVLRLRSVLGQKTGHQQKPPMEELKNILSQDEDKVVQLHQKEEDNNSTDKDEDKKDDLEKYEGLSEDIISGIENVKKADSSFSLSSFIQGASAAFEMVMEAYETGDKETLKQLLSKDLYNEFEQAISAREKEEKREHTTLVAMVSSEPEGVSLSRGKAVVEVKFTSEQIRVVKDKQGNADEGSSSNIIKVEDSWVFERKVKQSDPNWIITST